MELSAFLPAGVLTKAGSVEPLHVNIEIKTDNILNDKKVSPDISSLNLKIILIGLYFKIEFTFAKVIHYAQTNYSGYGYENKKNPDC